MYTDGLISNWFFSLIGALASSKSAEFVTALSFAQEYGILAASLQDRPFVPVSSVVLDGVPKDFKAVFRKWEDKGLRSSGKMAGSLKVVSLNAAIEATRGGGAE